MKTKSAWRNVLVVLITGLALITVSCSKKQPSTIGPVGASTIDPISSQDLDEAEQQRIREQEMERLRQQEAGKQDAVRRQFMDEHVYFDFDDATLSQEARRVLTDKAAWLRANADVIVTIEGHCDERGTAEYNIALGQRRAQSIKTFLVNAGIDASRVRTVSFGEERPIDPGRTEEAYAKNRRGQFRVDNR